MEEWAVACGSHKKRKKRELPANSRHLFFSPLSAETKSKEVEQRARSLV
jgi:hypothetical protein